MFTLAVVIGGRSKERSADRLSLDWVTRRGPYSRQYGLRHTFTLSL